MRTLYPVSITIDELADEAGSRSAITPELLREALTSDAHHAYDAREEALGAEVMREVERRVVMSVLDRKWREHLYEMDYLQEGIGLRAMAQRDPLVEYQREGFLLFEAMMDGIKEESVGYLFNVDVQVDSPAGATPEPAQQPMSVSDMLGSLSTAGGAGRAGRRPGGGPAGGRRGRRARARRCRVERCRALDAAGRSGAPRGPRPSPRRVFRARPPGSCTTRHPATTVGSRSAT